MSFRRQNYTDQTLIETLPHVSRKSSWTELQGAGPTVGCWVTPLFLWILFKYKLALARYGSLHTWREARQSSRRPVPNLEADTMG